MKVTFRASLGLRDAAALKAATGCELSCSDCTYCSEHDVPAKAARWLADRNIVDATLTGEAKEAEITAPEPSHSKAEQDVKRYAERQKGSK